MDLSCSKLLDSLKLKKVVKVISGLNNLDINKIYKILKSAEIAQADYIDLAANSKVISLLSKIVDLPLCVSSIDPIELYNCSVSGADILEVGNFDVFYEKKFNFSSFDILKLAFETRRLIQNKDICVTIPHTLSLYEQILLAKKLEKLGINFLQTEGISHDISLLSKYKYDNISKLVNVSASTLSSAYILSNLINIPIISSSKINFLSTSTSIICGASGVGIKSAIYNKKTVYEMFCYIDELLYSINLNIQTSYFTKPSLTISNYSKNFTSVKV